MLVNRNRSNNTFDGLAAIQAQLNNLGMEIKKVPFPQAGRYRAAGPGFYQKDNGSLSYQERRIQRASVKALEIQIGQMNKVLQERRSRSLLSLTETNPRDHVKSISTSKEAETPLIRQYGDDVDEVSKELEKLQVNSMESGTCLGRLLGEKWRIEQEIKAKMNEPCSTIVKDALSLKEKDPGIAENIDAYHDKDMGDVIVGKPFCRDACVEARWFDGLITIHNGSDSVTYQMARSHPRFKHLSNEQCNKIRPLLKRCNCYGFLYDLTGMY
nr:hypothetical protein [Tanacetum cinerariifolium]